MLVRRNRSSRPGAGRARRLATALAATAGVAVATLVAGLAGAPPAGAATAAATGSSPPAARSAGNPVAARHATAAPAPTPVVGNPYYLASSTGAVWPLGGAPDYGSLAGTHLAAPIVGITVTPDARGYWLVASDGGVFGFGDAGFYGSTGGIRLNRPVVGMQSTPDGRGYWLFAGDGGIFTFGDARFYGSTGAVRLARPIIGMTATPDGQGYWLYAGDGGIFTFGDARFYGSTGAVALAQPIVGMAPTADDGGYWLVAADGGVFSFGDAAFAGSLAGAGQATVSSILAAPGGGYWEVTHDGDVYPFGAAVGATVPTLALMHTIAGPGDVAMEWAMAQLGKPYLWGGTGPAAFDCSGLVMRAWQAAGIAIPRVAAEQYSFGTHVALDQLHIGDLVFWASNPAQPSTIEHVAMYIGGQHMVNAPYTGQVVRTDWIGGTGFVGQGTRP